MTSEAVGYLDDARGHGVKQVQKALRSIGLYHGSIDGKRGDAYRKAVKQFNRQYGELQQDEDVLSERGLQYLTLRIALK